MLLVFCQVVTFVIILYMMLFYGFGRVVDTTNTRLFRAIMIVSLVTVIFEGTVISLLNYFVLINPFLLKTVIKIYYLLAAGLLLLSFFYVFNRVREKKQYSLLECLFAIVPFAGCFMAIVSGTIKYRSPDGYLYADGTPRLAFYCYLVVVIIELIIGVIYYKKDLKKYRKKVLYSGFVFVVLMGAISYFNPSVFFGASTMVLIIVVIFAATENPRDYFDTRMKMFNKDAFLKVLFESKLEHNGKFAVVVMLEDFQTSGSSNEAERKLEQALKTFVVRGIMTDIYVLEGRCFGLIAASERMARDFVVKLEDWLQSQKVDNENEYFNFNHEIDFINFAPSECHFERDIDQKLMNSIEEIREKQFYRDKMLGVYNRNAYERDIKLLNAKRIILENVWILLVDVNNLKITNDLYGHIAGDRLLQNCVKQMKQACEDLRETRIYRVGGDEFCIIAVNLDAKKYINMVKTLRELRDADPSISYAIGSRRYNANIDNDLYDTFRRSDKVMYSNKIRIKAALEEAEAKKEKENLDN